MCNEGAALLGLPHQLSCACDLLMLWRNLSLSLSLVSLFGSCHKFTKVFLYAKACSRTRFVLHLLLLVAAADGEAAVIESIDAFATRIS